MGSVASRQHGLITLEQLRRAELSVAQVRGLVERGGLVLMRRRVYRLSGAPITWPQAVLAAVLAAGAGAVASHTTAGALWNLDPLPRSGDTLHVTASHQLRLEGVRGHCRPLSVRERRIRNGIPVTSVERTVLDLAGILNIAELGRCVDDALRRGLLGLGRLRLLVDHSAGPGRRRIRPLRLVLADRLDGYDPGGSDWERSMDRLWDKLGLPASVRQYPVVANGRRYILDRALPDLKIGVEWNGFASHGTRSAFDYDSDRRADLTAEGWHMVDFTSRSDPDRMVAAVRGAIQTRSGCSPSVFEH